MEYTVKRAGCWELPNYSNTINSWRSRKPRKRIHISGASGIRGACLVVVSRGTCKVDAQTIRESTMNHRANELLIVSSFITSGVYSESVSTYLYLAHLDSLFLAVAPEVLFKLRTTIVSVDGSVK